MIARNVHNHTPLEQLKRNAFSQFVIGNVNNINEINNNIQNIL